MYFRVPLRGLRQGPIEEEPVTIEPRLVSALVNALETPDGYLYLQDLVYSWPQWNYLLRRHTGRTGVNLPNLPRTYRFHAGEYRRHLASPPSPIETTPPPRLIASGPAPPPRPSTIEVPLEARPSTTPVLVVPTTTPGPAAGTPAPVIVTQTGSSGTNGGATTTVVAPVPTVIGPEPAPAVVPISAPAGGDWTANLPSFIRTPEGEMNWPMIGLVGVGLLLLLRR